MRRISNSFFWMFLYSVFFCLGCPEQNIESDAGETEKNDAGVVNVDGGRNFLDGGSIVNDAGRVDGGTQSLDAGTAPIDGVDAGSLFQPRDVLTTVFATLRPGLVVDGLLSGGSVSGGVPLPRGLIFDAAMLGLEDEQEGRPLQTQVLSRWPDDSLRWVLLDTEVNLPRNTVERTEVELSLVLRETPRPAEDGISIAENATNIVVDTGPMQVTIPTNYGGVLHQILVDGQEILAPPTNDVARIQRGPYVSLAGTDFYGALNLPTSNPAPADYFSDFLDNGGDEYVRFDPWHLDVTIEKRGALRSSVRISGAMLDATGASFCTFIARLHFARGERTFRTQLTWTFTGAGNVDEVEQYGFRVPLAGTSATIEGVSGTGQLTHLASDSFSLPSGTQSGQAKGQATVAGDGFEFGVVMRDMAEHFPKAIAVETTGIDVQLHPNAAGVLDLSRYSDVRDSSCGETGSDENRGSQGLARTNEFYFIASASSIDNAQLDQFAAQVDEGGPSLRTSSRWISDARVMGVGPFFFDTSLNENEVHFRIDRQLRIIEDFMRLAQRREFSWFGANDYGDIRGLFNSGGNGNQEFVVCGRYGFSGNSGEPSNQLWLQYLRAPHQALFLDAEALARHTMDLQMVHFGTAQDSLGGLGRNSTFSVGSLHRHGMQAFSGYAKQPEYSHVGGVETYYYLSGDERARDALFEAAQFIERYAVDISMVNGIGVLSRAIAAFRGDGSISPDVVIAWESRLEALVANLDLAHLQDELQGSKPPFNGFIRGMTGLIYLHEYQPDNDVTDAFFSAADVALAQADDWNLTSDPDTSTEMFHMNTFAYAASVAAASGRSAQPFFDVTKGMLEQSTHTVAYGGLTGEIPLSALQEIPENWQDWVWNYTIEYNEGAGDILWLHRQILFFDDNLQGYHSYRAFVHLATLAAAVPPETPGLTAR